MSGEGIFIFLGSCIPCPRLVEISSGFSKTVAMIAGLSLFELVIKLPIPIKLNFLIISTNSMQ